MFQSSKNLMRAVLDVVDDMLVGAPEPELEPEPEADVVAPHPHLRSVQLRRERREGALTAPPTRCLSPVRPPAQRHLATAGHR